MAKTFNNESIYVDPVDTAVKHDDMWRWDQRMFRHRHPQSYTSFDLVGLELGRNWWSRYPEQDWVLRDWHHEQVGQYCLCPIKKEIYDQLISGEIVETGITPEDIITPEEINFHSFWYLANFMRARLKPKIKKEVAIFASNTMIKHCLERMLTSNHFASAFGKEVSILAFVEARSVDKTAQKFRFKKAHPHTLDATLEKIYCSVWTRKQITVKLRQVVQVLGKLRPIVKSYEESDVVAFQQPPDY